MHCANIFWFCLIGLLIPQCHSKNVVKTKRIIGGNITTIEQTPYIIQLWGVWEGFFCAGTLIASRYVATAAHCLDSTPYRMITVVGGAGKLTDQGVKRKIVKTFVSPYYNPLTSDSDVAVLKLDKDMTGDNIQIMPLCSHSLAPGDFLQVSGWGRTDEDSGLSQDLRTVRVKIVDQDACSKLHGKGEITNNMVCAADDGKDACTSDSGGPGISRGELCGIVSWGIGCGRKTNPGVYTRVESIRWFIDSALES